jgi:hypothetical protein
MEEVMNIRVPFAAIVLLAACNTQRNLVPPEEAAQKFLADLDIKIQGKPNCTGVDTDNDGYLTCTVMLAAPSSDGSKMLSLQCAGITATDGKEGTTFKYAVGCKETAARALPTPRAP